MNKIDRKKKWSTVILCMLLYIISPNVSLNAQTAKIGGKVSDTEGNALSGATVHVKGTTIGAVTNKDGDYVLNNVSEGSVLEFILVGYVTKEVTAGSSDIIDVTLEESTQELDEVIVIGYGTARRKDYTGSVGSVKIENTAIATLPNLNVLEALKGTITGMNVGPISTAGGDTNDDELGLLIRGQNSINGNNKPLIILDGVIFQGSITDINPNDISAVDVLKDAVSAAVYGSRSANGVISITTKRGRIGKPVITLNATAGIQTWANNKPKFASGPDWLADFNVTAGREPDDLSALGPEIREVIENGGKGHNVLDMITHVGSLQDYQIAVSGATKDINYYLSTSYEYNHGVFIGDKYNRISAMGKINANITKWLNIGVDASFSRRDYSGVAVDFGGMQMGSPYFIRFSEVDKLTWTYRADEPLWGINDGYRDNHDFRYNFRLNTYAVINIPWIKGLSFKTNFIPNLYQVRQDDFLYETYYQRDIPGPWTPDRVQGLLSRANGQITRNTVYDYVFDNILTYKNQFGKHSVEATLVATRDFTKSGRDKITGKDFLENGNTTLGIGGLTKATYIEYETDIPNRAIDNWEKSNVGYLGRISYGYNDRYFINASLRRDGASVFGANRKWGNFAGVSAAWIISEEQFLKGFTPLNNLKLKAAFGQNGNQGLSPYSILAKVINGSAASYMYEFSDTEAQIYYSIKQSSMSNSNMGWEKTSAWDFGFESEWLNRRISAELGFYFSKTTDQIFERTIPSMTGFDKIYASMGQVNNKGIELSLRTVNIQNKNWTWTTFATFWKNSNKLIHLYNEDIDGDGKEDDDIASELFIGESLGSIFGYRQTGIVQEDDTEYIELNGTQAGNPKYDDMIDGVPGLTADDRTILGTKKENFRLNFGTTLRYKNLELYMLAVGVFGGKDTYLKENQFAYIHYEAGRQVLDEATYFNRPYWTPENKSNVYPKQSFPFRGDGRFKGLQTRTWMRIQDISLSYSFNSAAWMKSLNVNSLKVFLAAKNVAVFTKWFGFDPEQGTGWMDGSYPVPATYSLGVNLSF
ncbi:MAG: SusC/RagA family TonB-linked outer membrane protein [Prevotellaceae bacterium]|jgi:TonB-linked SusC/RagA family outer membrane protein|nr:SusC/RagA family TonB-linked outer membrane protein [Prevotellaceae bacterium]